MLTAARQPRFARFICDNLSLITLRIFYLTAWRARHISRPAWLIQGRLRRRSRWRSEAWRPAAAARNRQPREVRDPVRQALRPGREEHRCTDPEEMPEMEARDPGPKSPRWSAERRASPRWGTIRRLASAWRAAQKRVHARLGRASARRGCRCTRAPSRRSATPRWVAKESFKPRAPCVAGTNRAV